MKKKYLAILLACVLPLVSACSNDDDNAISENETEEQGIVSNQLKHYQMMLSQFCTVDSTSAGAVVYHPRLGEAIEATQPSVYYVGVESEQEARNCFTAYFFMCDSISGEILQDLLTVDYGSYGYVKYTPADGRSVWATVDVNLPELKDVVSKIVFIPKAKWPTNYSSPFYPGDIVRGNNGWLWLCVRACEGGRGILMTWDGGTKSETRKDHYKLYTKVTGCAPKEAWDALAQFYYSDVAGFNKMYDEIEKATWLKNSESRLLEYDYALYQLRYHKHEDNTYQVGDTWDNEYVWLAKIRSVWEAETYWVKLKEDCTWVKGMPQFESGKYSFKRDWPIYVPDFRSSHALFFTQQDGNMTEYTKVYPTN